MSIEIAIGASFQILFGVLGALGNFLCFAVLRHQSKENHTNWLIVTQSVIDLVTSLILIASTIQLTWIGRPPIHTALAGEFYCRLWNSQVLTFCGFAISTFNLTVISIERYVAVVYPVLYATRFKRGTIYLLVVPAWLIAPMLQIVFAAARFEFDESLSDPCVHVHTSATVNVVEGIAVFILEFFLPVTIMGYSFARITHRLQEFNRVRAAPHKQPPVKAVPINSLAMQLQTQSEPSAISHPSSSVANDSGNDHGEGRPIVRSGAEGGRNLRRRNVTITLLIVYVTYLICWTPNQISFFVFNMGGFPNYLGSTCHVFTKALATLNICVNPIVYAFRYNAFKRGMKEKFAQCKLFRST